MKCVNVNKKILIVAIVILCIFAVFSFTMVSNAEEVTVIGTWDISKDDGTSKVTATLYSDGRFVISGTGEMKDYSGSNNSPYYNYKESIKTVEIQNEVTSIGNYAFENCKSLTSIEISSNVTIIGDDAFAYCTNLTSIEIPSSVTSVGYYAFSECTSLNSINVDKSNQKYSSEDGILFDKDKKELIRYPTGKKEKEYNIPSSVTRIEWAAFSGCTSLTSIEIPSSVTSIGGYAFDRAKLTMVVVAESKNVQEIELPDIIKRAMNKGDILYTSSDFELTNCSLTEDKTKLEVASKETVRLKVKEGALSGISVVVKVVSLKKYEVTEENGEVYIEDINPGTKIQEFIDNIETNGTMKFYKGNSEITDVNSKVQTGMIMKITLGEQETSCKLVVKGDLNGDGEMGDIDLLKLVRYQAGLDTSLNGAYLKAADVYKDGTYADNKDLLKMARVLAGLDSL